MIQDKAHSHAHDEMCMMDEKHDTERYKHAKEKYLSFLRQKAKEGWIDKGDDNTRVFHQSIKARWHMNKIYAVQDSVGSWLHEDQFFYQGLLGTRLKIGVM